MPRDQRLYMTFPIEMPDHPKVKPLSPTCKWHFVEMNAYSRRQGLDGVIPVRTALAMWPKKSLDELVASDPERPLVMFETDKYVIRDYSEHQLTEADIEDLRTKRASAGAKGGAAKAAAQAKQGASKALALAKQKGSQGVAESESELKLEITDDITNDPEVSHVGDVAAFRLEISEVVAAKAKQAGVNDFAAVYRRLEVTCGPISTSGAVDLVNAITARAKGNVRDVDAYVATACRNTPDEVRFDYDRLDLAVAS